MARSTTRLAALFFAISLAAFALPSSEAARVKVWRHYAANHFDKAEFKGAVVTSEGALHLARELKPLAALDVMHVWDVVEDQSGNLFVATGDEGKIFKIAPDGKVAAVWVSQDSQVLCLAVGPDGSIYAGTGPGGSIVCVPPQGKARTVVEDLDNYVWCLAIDPATKSLLAGTGPKGKIYQVQPDGKASVFYSTKQDHILCMSRTADGMVYAGTDKGGFIYRIDPKGKGFVIHSTAQSEVRSLLATKDGIYAGTSSPVKRRSTATGAANASTNAPALNSQGGLLPPSRAEVNGGGVKSAAIDAPPPTADSNETKANAAPPPAPPSAGENSLYRISPDGTVRELFREKAMLLSLARQDGRILVGTGMQGQLFEVEEATKERTELARLDHGQIHCLLKRRDGSIVVGTGDPGKLYVLQARYADAGSVLSEILDAKIISKSGALEWQPQIPKGASASVSVRVGNTPFPDETWSAWSPEQFDSAHSKVNAPPARYLQYRVSLKTTNASVTPTVRGMTVRYMMTNQAPEITSLEIPDLDGSALENSKKLKFKWTAVDPNEDELLYTVYVRKDGWPDWVKIEDHLEKTSFEWDTTTSPAGIYQFKVVASDRKDNAPEEVLTAEKISAPFPVAHAPPIVTITVAGTQGDQVLFEATATDPLIRLTEAAFTVNGKRWTSVFPKDGLFDSKKEDFRFKTDPLPPGTYVVVLRVRDAAGNVGTGDVVFSIGPQKNKQ